MADGFAHARHDRIMDGERGTNRPLRVVAMRDRRTEHRHDAVADVLVDGAAVALDHAVEGFEEAAGDLMQLFRVQPAGELGVAGQVGEQHRHLPPLALGQYLRAGADDVLRFRLLARQLGDGGEQLLAVADREDAELLEVPRAEGREHGLIDVVVRERVGVFTQSDGAQPSANVHH